MCTLNESDTPAIQLSMLVSLIMNTPVSIFVPSYFTISYKFNQPQGLKGNLPKQLEDQQGRVGQALQVRDSSNLLLPSFAPRSPGGPKAFAYRYHNAGIRFPDL